MDRISKEEFDQIVLDGLAIDIFIAERSFGMFKAIGERIDAISQSKHADVFKVTQTAFKDQFLLATARLFDVPSTRNKTRCIHGLLEFMANNQSRLPAIVERAELIDAMVDAGFDESVLRLANNEDQDEEVARQIIKHF